MKFSILLLNLLFAAGCTSSLGFGGDEGVGIKSSLAKDGKIVSIEPTDGDGRLR
jgi:hypothetical protein